MTVDFDSARFSRMLRAAVLWPVGITFATALLLLVFTVDLFEMVSWTDHSYKVLAQTRKCENLVIGSQNSARGYLLTADAEFLDSYNSHKSEIEAEMELKELVKTDPEQSIRAEDLVQAETSLAAQTSTMLSQRTHQVAVSPDWVRVSRTLLESVRTKFDQFSSAEEATHDLRSQQVRRMKTVLAYAGVALVLLVVLSIAHLVRKQILEIATNYRQALETVEHRHAELRRSENDLEDQKEWLRVTLTSIGDGVIVTDPLGRIVLMNHESERLTGWTQAEALHQPVGTVFRVVNEETRAALPEPVEMVLKEKKTASLAGQALLFSRNGEEWPIDDSAAPICDPSGKILGVVMVFHDASATRASQKNLKAYSSDLERIVADRTTALQQMVSELEAFSYTVSHDLRAPLRAMQGFAEALHEDYGDKLDERGKGYLQRIQNAAGRLDRLIQDLLSYTRISRAEAPLEPFDLNKVVNDIVEHDVTLNPPVAKVTVSGVLPRVLGRESALNQVIGNLLSNAVKFVKPGTTPDIRVRAEDRGAMVRLWVEDNGIGIAPENQGRIFDMFTQINEASLYGGTGVGLAIVRKVAQTIHGAVGVESVEGEGSRFWVDLNKVA